MVKLKTTEVRYSTETDHLMVKAKPPWGEPVWVDEGIAALLKALWKHGYHTDFSCQGGESQPGGYTGKAYISFAHWDEAVRFVYQCHERFGKAQADWSKDKRFYVHVGLLMLEISDPDHGGAEGPRGCVRFYPTAGNEVSYSLLEELTALWSE